MQGKENGHSQGGFKFALGGEGIPPVYDLLEKLGVTEPIRMSVVITNGHRIVITWTGTQISVGELSAEVVQNAGGTGCLEIEEGPKRTISVIEEGRLTMTTVAPKGMDPRQMAMEI